MQHHYSRNTDSGFTSTDTESPSHLVLLRLVCFIIAGRSEPLTVWIHAPLQNPSRFTRLGWRREKKNPTMPGMTRINPHIFPRPSRPSMRGSDAPLRGLHPPVVRSKMLRAAAPKHTHTHTSRERHAHTHSHPNHHALHYCGVPQRIMGNGVYWILAQGCHRLVIDNVSLDKIN